MTINRNRVICYLVEGETEESLLIAMKVAGRIEKINLWDRDIKKIFGRLNYSNFYIVFDTDKTSNIRRFEDNLRFLKKKKVNFKLLQQTHNLEDEIIRSTSCNRIEDFFNCSVSEFKNRFNNCSNLTKKLDDYDFKSNKLWQGEIINQLKNWESYRHYDALPKLK